MAAESKQNLSEMEVSASGAAQRLLFALAVSLFSIQELIFGFC